MRRNQMKSNVDGAVGMGALIVYVGTIILAILISFTLLNLTEKLSQNTQQTAEDVRRDSVNSIIITGAWVYDNYDDMLFMI